ncbi:helix-turn-helix domain-containing protein [Trinickia dinghuensis]|nr:AraC family transcriptional regulator [Trinickia dinghuensis]
MSEPIAQSETGGIVAELWPAQAYEVDDTRALGIAGFAFATQAGIDAIDTGRRRPFHRRVNSLSWVPPGCPVYSSSSAGGEYLVIQNVRADTIGHADATQRSITNLVDEEAIATAHGLRRALMSGRDVDLRAILDNLSALLLAHFAPGATAPTEWLTNSRLTAIDRFIDAHLHERIEVAQLAAELELSVGFLVCAFKRGAGTTPHRYLMERRLAHARALLESGLPIADTAFECGFADQAHLTRHMRSVLGITPRHYRLSEHTRM